uniref:LEAF RUST 10 DISEASE-RESISTANCE LOCUS RECEPTOR-LIKE PROTEIN KINASE-like 2.4 n=1 Tax=Erigeron canadensis TaxID=72917 RepID=UPI001CB9080C|nr:LEAF RUST 10 DISEASE-RESISTANCE LOCUS RECEPTOR-LIKE PROTEIN KINASE-like 2.4 [Erigeron canadensis]
MSMWIIFLRIMIEFLAPKKYSYSQVKKMTNSFKVKLGQGGFGSVYKGELSNGTLVAVKVLSELKGNGEDFINEVASVGRTCHVNIVTLVGFCCDDKHRALIYEFMPNGSLESYGMMILEMVGGRKNIEVEVDHTSELYFPYWIYKKLEVEEQRRLGLHGIMTDEDDEMVRKMLIVGLWCIQTNPLNRPAITKGVGNVRR